MGESNLSFQRSRESGRRSINGSDQGSAVVERANNLQRLEREEIARTALQNIGRSTKDPYGPPKSAPDYALAVSRIFSEAIGQTIILGTPSKNVLSTSILWASLMNDKRFTQVQANSAVPGDIVIGSGWQQGRDGFAGIVVEHDRIVCNSSQGVQNRIRLESALRTNPNLVAQLIRDKILAKVESEFSRMKVITNDPSNPLTSVRVITNDPKANQYFQGLLKKYNLPGEVVNQ